MHWIRSIFQQGQDYADNPVMQRQFLLLVIGIMALAVSYKLIFQQVFTHWSWVALGAILMLTFLRWSKKTNVVFPFLFVWMSLGLVIGEIMSLLVLSLMYLLIFTPVVLFIRLFKKADDSEGHWAEFESSKDYTKLS